MQTFPGKRVLVRVDFNVPLDGTATVTDDTRIRAALPTIENLIGDGARVDPREPPGPSRGDGLSRRVLAAARCRASLQELLGKPVAFATDTIGGSAKATVAAL